MSVLAAALALMALSLFAGTAMASSPERSPRGSQTEKKQRCSAAKKSARCRKRARCNRRGTARRARRCVRRAPRAPAAPPRGAPVAPGLPTPPAAPPVSAPPPPDPALAMSVTAREWSLTSSRAVLAAGAQTIELRNWGEDPHNLVISQDDGSHSPLAVWETLDPDGNARRDTALPAGRYLLWCSLDGHEAAGMATTLRVE